LYTEKRVNAMIEAKTTFQDKAAAAPPVDAVEPKDEE
jgi:hypothetical protein